MTRILFVCHGNICRSPMAEFIMKKLVSQNGLSQNFHIESAATSTEEIGNDIHSGAKNILLKNDVPFSKRKARKIIDSDYNNFDYLIAMDVENIYYIQQQWNKDPCDKIKLLLSSNLILSSLVRDFILKKYLLAVNSQLMKLSLWILILLITMLSYHIQY